MPSSHRDLHLKRAVTRLRDAYQRFRSGRLPEEVEAAMLRAGISPPRPQAPVVDVGADRPLLERLWRQAVAGLAVALFLLSMGALTLFAAQLIASYLLLTRALGVRVELDPSGRPA
jgi:hypothetical protein